ncbi:MAG: peptide ABC transporter substrate-binding protein, partial [Pseudomonadota bacterium]|nr:peptide ABC transporter substrate-binding protein [Pseudomonadota bacterium]
RRDGRITQVFRGGWIGDVDDPLSFLSLFAGAQALNWSGWQDQNFIRLLSAADADAARRMHLLHQAEQLLLDQHAIIPLYFYTSKHLVRAEVRGFEANLLDRHPSRWMHLAASTTAP